MMDSDILFMIELWLLDGLDTLDGLDGFYLTGLFQLLVNGVDITQ